MQTSHREIARLLAGELVVAAREHPALRGALEWQVRVGRLTAVLPGVYAPTSVASDPATRVAAVGAWDPDAVVGCDAAAWVAFWPGRPVGAVTCFVRHRRPARPGFEFRRGRPPAQLLRQTGRTRLTGPALTALDLADCTDGGSIDQVLRVRAATLAQLHEALALTAGRPGNQRRRQLLLDSRDEPWSRAERVLHRLLRAGRIRGWRANWPVRVAGRRFYLDVAFPGLRLALEVDGREFHSSAEAFESDRARQNQLTLHGWRVLRLTWRMIEDDPQGVLALIRSAVALAELGRPGIGTRFAS